MSMAVDDESVAMMKLPLPFIQIGMSVHPDFDAIAEGAAKGEGVLKHCND